MITLKKISKATGLPPHLLPKKKKKIEFTGLCGEKKKCRSIKKKKKMYLSYAYVEMLKDTLIQETRIKSHHVENRQMYRSVY